MERPRDTRSHRGCRHRSDELRLPTGILRCRDDTSDVKTAARAHPSLLRSYFRYASPDRFVSEPRWFPKVMSRIGPSILLGIAFAAFAATAPTSAAQNNLT